MADDRTFIKVHDGMADHPKVEPLSDAAFRLLFETWFWCSRHRTDGFVPLTSWRKRATPKVRAELLVALAHECGHSCESCPQPPHGHIVMHDYLDWQRSAAEIAEVQEMKRKAGAKGNHKRWHLGPKGRPDPDCELCNTSQTASQVRSQNGRKASPETEGLLRNPQTETEQTPSGAARNVGSDRAREDPNAQPARPQSQHPQLETVPPPAVDRHHYDTAGKAVRGVIPTGFPTTIRRELTEISAGLLAEGLDPEVLTVALTRWASRPGVSPKILPHLVSDVLRERANRQKPPRSTTMDRQRDCFDRGRLYEEAIANGHTTPAEQFAYVAARQAGQEVPSRLAPVIELPSGRTA